MSDFRKYELKGAYHWIDIGRNPMKANSFVRARYNKCVELLTRHCGKQRGRVLDLGCGDAALSYILWQKGFQVTGIDVNSLGIELGRNMHREKGTDCVLEVRDIQSVPSESIELLVCSDVIEHVPDYESFRDQIYRVLVPGGVAVVSTPIRFTEYLSDSEHIIEWFPDEWKAFWSKYPGTVFYQSHPVAIMEFFRVKGLRFLVNLLSSFWDIYKYRPVFKVHALQYAVLLKEKRAS